MQRMLIVGLFALLFTMVAAAQDVYRTNEHITAPKIVETPKPRYLTEVATRGIVGVVRLEADVMPDGTVGTVALVKSLSQVLDEEAAEAVKKFRFTPGTKDGKPVAVRIEVELQFEQRSGSPWRLLGGPSPN